MNTKPKDREETFGVPDNENPEWTSEDFARAISFFALSAKLQEKLRIIMRKSGKD